MRKRDKIIPVVIFVILVISFTLSAIGVELRVVRESKQSDLYIAANHANIMKDSVDTSIARVYTFSALVRDNEGRTDFFDKESVKIYREIVIDSGIPIKNVAIAPDGVVEKVYPLEENEQLIGFDFLDTSKEGNTEAVTAYERGDVIITNPFSLIQGGVGMAGRLPVFVENENGEYFWGLVTVTIDFDKMIESFHLENLTEQKINYRLWYENDNGNQVSIASDGGTLNNPETYDFTIQNLRWHLDVEPAQGWHNYYIMALVFVVIIGISLLISLLIYDKNRIHVVNEKLELMANMDSLTGCFSRHFVKTVLLNDKDGTWNDKNQKYSLAIIDIDYFKTVNDTYGHHVGDRAIIAVADVLKEATSNIDGDCVIRHGGDEFVILWNDITREHFENKLKEIVLKVSNIKFSEFPELRLTLSIGGEFYTENETYFQMTKNADEKLYKAKDDGKNRYCI